MTTLNISLPDSMRAFIDEQVNNGGYSTASEYIRQLVRLEQKRAAQERLEQLLIDGLDSGEPIEVTPEWWAEKKARLLRSLEKREDS